MPAWGRAENVQMLPGGYSSVLGRGTVNFREVVRFARGWASRPFGHRGGRPRAQVVGVHHRRQRARRLHRLQRPPLPPDPVMQHCKRHSLPIIWDQAPTKPPARGDAPGQLRAATAPASRWRCTCPKGGHFMLGVDRDSRCPGLRPNCNGSSPTCSCSPCTRRTPPDGCCCRMSLQAGKGQRMTPRELECCAGRWKSKTAWEVGAILGINERTAVLHVNNAMHKLGPSANTRRC